MIECADIGTTERPDVGGTVTVCDARSAAKSDAFRGCSRHDLHMGGGWRRTPYVHIGGLTEVGFGHPAQFLLIVSHQGRGVVDCASGVRVARDQDEAIGWFDRSVPAVEGIGPLAGQWVPVAGLAGGSLAQVTHDGWRVTLATEGVAVHAPQDRDSRPSFIIDASEELRAWGFSPDGLTILVAVSSGITIYRRGFPELYRADHQRNRHRVT
jgi:hypothetical protein